MTRQGCLLCLGRHCAQLKELLAHSLIRNTDAVTKLEKNGSIKSDQNNKNK